MTPYYSDEWVSLYNSDCREIFATMADRSVTAVITDPPYGMWTHENYRSNSRSATRHGNRVLSGNFGFDAVTPEQMRDYLQECGRLSSGWVIASLDYRFAFSYDADPPEGLRLLRVGVWTKSNPMPQISGDRPAQGWEAIGFLHRTDTKPRWNGKGRAATWHSASVSTSDHPTAKPLPMVRDWVRLFTNPGDLVLDPFAGSGTTLRAAKDEGRRAVGVEINEAYCEITAKRLAQDVLDFGASA